MRDSNTGMVEIVGCEKSNDLYSSIASFSLDGENVTVKFGIVETDYFNIKKIISFRPFENTGYGPYKYFFSGSYQKNLPARELSTISVRVEQQRDHKQFDFCVTNRYVANLLWFKQVKNRAQIEALIVST